MASNLDRPWCWFSGQLNRQGSLSCKCLLWFFRNSSKKWMAFTSIAGCLANERSSPSVYQALYATEFFCKLYPKIKYQICQWIFLWNPNKSFIYLISKKVSNLHECIFCNLNSGDQREMNARGKNLIYGMLLVWCYARLNNKTLCLPFTKRASYLSATRTVACLNSTVCYFSIDTLYFYKQEARGP